MAASKKALNALGEVAVWLSSLSDVLGQVEEQKTVFTADEAGRLRAEAQAMAQYLFDQRLHADVK